MRRKNQYLSYRVIVAPYPLDWMTYDIAEVKGGIRMRSLRIGWQRRRHAA